MLGQARRTYLSDLEYPNGIMTLTVAHYLRIWTIRQGMARDGVTHPNDVGRKLIETLVSRLSEFPPSVPCELKRRSAPGGEWLSFVVEDREIAKLWIPDGSGEILLGDGSQPASNP